MISQWIRHRSTWQSCIWYENTQLHDMPNCQNDWCIFHEIVNLVLYLIIVDTTCLSLLCFTVYSAVLIKLKKIWKKEFGDLLLFLQYYHYLQIVMEVFRYGVGLKKIQLLEKFTLLTTPIHPFVQWGERGCSRGTTNVIVSSQYKKTQKKCI